MCLLTLPQLHPTLAQGQRCCSGAAKMTQERAAQSGAAASSAALAQAVRGITLLLCATLNDGDTPPGSAAAQSRRREPQSASSSAEALSALEALAVGQAAESVQPAPAEEVVAQALGTLGKYKVNRDTAWVDATLQRLAPLLERVLPPLCSHPQPAVREALAKGKLSGRSTSHKREKTLQQRFNVTYRSFSQRHFPRTSTINMAARKGAA